MLISVVDLALLGLAVVAVVTVWEQYQHKEQLNMLKDTVQDLVKKHNNLSDAFVNMGTQIEDELNDIDEEITDIREALE
jgi:archaellum component FlaC